MTSNLNDFYEQLQTMGGITPLSQKMHHFICGLHKDMSLAAQKVLYIYLSLLESGNTCTPLDAEKLLKKWEIKWNGLVALSQNRDQQKGESNSYPPIDIFKDDIHKGIKDFVSMLETEHPPLKKMNFKGISYLISAKHFQDKQHIEAVFKKGIFDGSASKASVAEINFAKKFVEGILKEDSPIKFDDCQAEIIARGTEENLIITGGPGTGKTTVIGFLLWKMLTNNSEFLNWNLYMAAPSGKAADRLSESMDDFLKDISQKEKDSHPDFIEKLTKSGSYTLHRLLKYSVNKGGFTYNSANPLPDKSIFIIDEASMIDISLFAAFLQALPKDTSKFKLFILGDPEQLPSVDAGAVLGNILELNSNFVVKLLKSNRFDDSSKIGRLSKAVQQEKANPEFETFDHKKAYWPTNGTSKPAAPRDDVFYLDLAPRNQEGPLTSKEELLQVEGLIKKWAASFCNSLVELAQKVDASWDYENLDESQFKICNDLWKAANTARILAAERRGNRGVETINNIICKSMTKETYYEGNFVGQLLMLNRNQNEFNLYNGDSGVVVKSSKNLQLYLMVNKQSKFLFYPLSYFAPENLESAFAITIHKSQGSGYPNIMMFLPKQKGHPLLTRQILYTGITRTKKESLTIVATAETFKVACQTVTERDTGIEIQ